MEIQIRKATAGDYRELRALFDEVGALHRDHLPELFQKPAESARDRDYLHDLMAREDTGLFVAQVGARIAGAIQVLVQDAPPIPLLVPRRFAIVEDLVVGGQFRRKGIGRALMEAAHRWTGAQGATSIELNVFEFNHDAMDFYRALGYHTRSRTMVHDLEATSSGQEENLPCSSSASASHRRQTP
jgi:ribosomal protein S18 acetylase RimI-like enzyme